MSSERANRCWKLRASRCSCTSQPPCAACHPVAHRRALSAALRHRLRPLQQPRHVLELVVDHRLLAHRQRLEVRPATLDLGALGVAQVADEQAALGLHHEVQPIALRRGHQHRPVGVVAAQRGGHLEPGGQLGVDLDRFVLRQLVGKVAFGVGVVDDVLVHRALGVQQHVLQVAGQLLGLEQLLRVVGLVAQPLVADAVHQHGALAAVDGLGHRLDELLRVALEVVQAVALDQDAADAAPRELGAVLQLGQDVRQLDVVLVEHHHVGALELHRRHAGLADLHARLAPLQPRLADGRRLDHRGDAVADQALVVELHPVCGFVLDAVPQGLELGAVEHRAPHGHLPAFVGVLDLQLARDLAQQLQDLRALRLHFRR
mmetsp:Transcript_41596/g.97602  ORF Transcript_41596/g.97602 Transcript_41596/m.97602 type:complete len:374 (+) Transcript_41596:154-1275(+)